MKTSLSQQELRALQSFRRAPHAYRVEQALSRLLQDMRDEFERTAPADELLRAQVLEVKTAYNLLFVDDLVLE